MRALNLELLVSGGRVQRFIGQLPAPKLTYYAASVVKSAGYDSSANLAHTMVGGNTKEQDQEIETNVALCFFVPCAAPMNLNQRAQFVVLALVAQILKKMDERIATAVA